MPASVSKLRIHHFEPASRANGPGWRAVLWLQGCTLGCPGCFNPDTHSSADGNWHNTADLCTQIAALGSSIEGITVSGGEPLQQLPGLINFLECIRRQTQLLVLLFTGYTWEEIRKIPRSHQLLPLVDVLLAGRYDQTNRVARGLVGSNNKTIHFLSSLYSAADLERVPEAEIILNTHGEIILSGIHPLLFNP
jgi:anaerobic ribonucleoside-triphosphate reductase activating protein